MNVYAKSYNGPESGQGRVDRYAAYGNFRFDSEIPPEAKTAEGLLALYTPRRGVEPDALGTSAG